MSVLYFFMPFGFAPDFRVGIARIFSGEEAARQRTIRNHADALIEANGGQFRLNLRAI